MAGNGYKLRVTVTGVQNPVIASSFEIPQGMHFVGVRLRVQNLGAAIDSGDITNSQLTDSVVGLLARQARHSGLSM